MSERHQKIDANIRKRLTPLLVPLLLLVANTVHAQEATQPATETNRSTDYSCPVLPKGDKLNEIIVDERGQVWGLYAFKVLRFNEDGTVSELVETPNYLGDGAMQGIYTEKVLFRTPRTFRDENGEVSHREGLVITTEGLKQILFVYSRNCNE